jgi:hypothetical protein
MATKNYAALLLVLSFGSSIGFAQQETAAPAGQGPRGGVSLDSISAFYFYATQPLFPGLTRAVLTRTHIAGGGGAATLAWRHFGSRSTFTASYSGSYFGSSQAVDSSSLNHAMSIDLSRALQRWTVGFALNGQLSGSQQYLFNPSSLGQIAAAPSTFDDLASAMLTGNSTNTQLNGLVNGAPLLESPIRTSLYGERVASGGATTYARYNVSPRLTIRMGASAFKALHLAPDTQSQTAAERYILPQSTSVGGDFGISYSLSPRTQIGANLGTSRVFSRIQPGYYTTGTGSIGRIMGRRWFVDGHAGAGMIFQVGDLVTIQRHRISQPVVGGSIAYRTGAHTLMLVNDWTLGDPYGAGSTRTITSTFSWTWAPIRSGWSFALGGGHQQLFRDGATTLTGEGANARVGRAITRQISLLFEYGFQTNYGSLTGAHLRQQGVRVSLAWMPRQREMIATAPNH